MFDTIPGALDAVNSWDVQQPYVTIYEKAGVVSTHRSDTLEEVLGDRAKLDSQAYCWASTYDSACAKVCGVVHASFSFGATHVSTSAL